MFSNSHKERGFRQLNISTKHFFHQTEKVENCIEKLLSVGINKNAVCHYGIAFWKPKSNLEAIKHSYYYELNPKFFWKCRAFHDSSREVFSTPSSPTKQVRTRCTSTSNTKTILENIWSFASYYIKPNSSQKTPCFGKIPTEKVFLVVWVKLNFLCTSFTKAKK